MFIVSCKICLVEFEAKSKLRMYCTRSCKDKGKPSASGTCCVCGLAMVRGRSSRPQGEAAHNSCKVTPGTDKDKKAAYMKQYHADYQAKHGKSQAKDGKRRARGVDPDISVACFICKLPLMNVRANSARYPLHKACRATAPKWIKIGDDSPKVTKLRAKIEKAAAGTSGKRVFASGHCPWCGDYFMRANAKWCSSKCKTAARFAAKSSTAFRISPIDRLSVYERDGWDCQLCGFPVDRALHYLDDWSATLDHIIPQSHQLVPDHSPKALRLAHRWCNSARGDGSNMTEGEFLARVSVRYQESLAA